MQHTEVTIFKQLLAADVVRGRHATGVACVDDKSGDISVTKRAVPAHDFLDMSRMTKDLNVFQRAMLGHNRHATQGASDNHDNAHPFTHGDITLMHNGSLRNRRGLIDSKSFAVDSENICHTFAQKDYMDVIPELDGAFCLIWHDARDGCIRFVRNSERPLTFGFEQTRTQTNYFYASEPDMLKWVLGRNNTQAELHELQPGVVITVDPDLKVSKEKVELYTPPKPQYPAQYGGRGGNYYHSQGNIWKELNMEKGDAVEVEITSCKTMQSSHSAQSRYQWTGHLVEDPTIVVRAYGLNSVNKHELYLATASAGYRHVDGSLNLNVNNLIDLPNTERRCELCDEKIESSQSYVKTEFGTMHADCYAFFMKDDEAEEAKA